ncbi:MAG: pyridoxamine 5'-phosphate oxidase [Myxococcota bacterium]
MFRASLARVRDTEPLGGTAFALATADAQGRPSVRYLLLKGVDDRGFTFFTNFDSRKAHELEANPFAALCFHWPSVEEQVRIEGPVDRVSEEEADAYFESRPRESRIGAWASMQSAPVGSREALEARFRETEERFVGQRVPRPPHWGGYRVIPRRIEFWFGRAHRLHDRLVYTAARDGGWTCERLYP